MNPLVVVFKYPVLLYPVLHVTLHTGLLLLLVATVPEPLVIEQFGVLHTAYNVVLPLLIMFWIFAFSAYAVPLPSAAVFHPVSILAPVPVPLVILHVLLFHVGAVHVPLYEHVMLPFAVPDTPPHVPVPPFLFNTIVNVFAVHFAYNVPLDATVFHL